jgi:hypothetical protein
MIVAIGGLPDASDAQGDTFFEIPAKGWYATASPMWYATGVHGGPVTVHSSAIASFFYLAEYPPAALDQVAPQVFNCCNPSVTIGLTTTLPSELLIEWTIFTSSVSVQDAKVSPGAQSFTLPQVPYHPWGAELASFRLLGPEFVKYKAPYAPIQLKACIGSTCQFDNPVSTNDLLVAAISHNLCDEPQNNCVIDTQSNAWHEAVFPSNDGRIWYALNTKAGVTSVSFAPRQDESIVIVEYPPAVAFDGSSYGIYGPQNLDVNAPGNDADDVGWTLPIQTTKSCDLLVSIGVNINTSLDPTSTWMPSPGPYFTVRGGFWHRMGLEDGTSSVPGVYIASMNFNDYIYWVEEVAAFDMNGCK